MTNLINDFFSMPLWFSIPLGMVYVALFAYFVYTLWHYHRNSLKLAMLTAALFVGQTALAEGKWTVTNENGSSNTFTIKRSEKGYTQTVHLRTISLSAYAGQHFTAVDMDYTFPADEDEKTVTVTEMNPSTNAYKYQTGASRKYGFEVIDRAGFRLAYAERSKTWGTSVPSSGIFGVKSIDVGSGETTVTDDGYINNPYRTMAGSDYYDYAAPKAWLSAIGATLHMTLSMKVKEVNDGYQYIQVLFDNTSSCDDRSNCSDGNPGNINLSRYMAGFGHHPSSYDGNWSTYTFPVTSRGNNCGTVSNPWGNTIDAKLYDQKFGYDSYRDTDGKLIIPTEFTTLVLRLNASGNNEDNWTCKDVTAEIQAIDGTAPTKSAVSVNPGRHAKGNTVYVSVAFSEIVTVTGTPTLTTTSDNKWGNLTYVDGSGTNVLTFSTTIPQNATGDLNITGISGTIQDLAGNSLSGGVTASSICTLDDDFAYTIDEFQKDGDNYLIKTHEDLIGLAGYVNGGGATKGKTFLQVADIVFPHTTNWNNSASTENNYIAIGYYIDTNNESRFDGTYDGGGHTISGIRIYRGGGNNSDGYQGLFGIINLGSIVRNVNLADTRITGYDSTGGIVGYNYGTITDCTVAANVCIHSVITNSYSHGGIVGTNNNIVQRSVSSAILTVKSGTSGVYYGGIAGNNYNSTITDCIADGVVIPDVNARGAIVGYQNNYCTFTRNYYHNCKVASDAVTPSGVGMGTEGSKTTSDVDGAQPLWAITLPTHASVVRTGTALPGTDNAIYDNGADINGVPYAKGSSVVNLSYDPATITEGYDVLLSVKQTSGNTAVAYTDNGNHTYTIASMPAADITVSATEIPVIAYIDADGNPQSHACTPIVNSNSDQKLGAEGCTNWYVVSGEVSTERLQFKDATTNIILCDGATLSVSPGQSNNAIWCRYGSINILAQSGGTGAINVTTACSRGIYANNSIDINGGAITVSNASDIGITASNGDVTIRRGNINVHGTENGIHASHNVNIQGGIINATCNSGAGRYGIKATNYGFLTLGCSSPTDRIYASSYYAKNNNVQVADGQILSDGTATYSGKLTSDEIAEIAGKTLSAAIPYIDADGTTKYKASHDLTFITTSKTSYGNAANTEGWYCVNSDVDFSSTVTFKDQQANIILCDGATMSGAVKGSNRALNVGNGSLAIYGQSLGTGTLTVSSMNFSAISAKTNIDINGGIINAKSMSSTGLYTGNGNITIRRGNITAKGGSATYGIIATTITLGCPTTADRIYASSYNGTVTIAEGQTLTDGYSANTYTGPLNDDQKAAIAGKTMMKALGDVSYIDEDGQKQTCCNYQILSDGVFISDNIIGKTLLDTWYVASGSYTFNYSYLETRGHVHVILCDGANFTVNGSGSYGIYALKTLSIYGQSQGTGTLTVNAADEKGKALYVDKGGLAVNGGVVNANGGEYGIYINMGHLAANGGTINATGTTSDIYAGVRIEKVNGILTAKFSGTSLETVSFPWDVTVYGVTLTRNFTAGKASTIMMPFDYTCNEADGGEFYDFVDVVKDEKNDQWVATMTKVDKLTANTPYMFMPAKDLSGITFTLPEKVALNTTGGGECRKADKGSNWTFKGTYKRLTYGTAPMTGHVYGFASKDKTVGGVDVKAGEFVKAKDGASVPPMRCYLTYKNGDEFTAEARGMTRGDEELPQTITVRFVSANGEVTGMATMNTQTGEITTDGWYTLSGTRLPGKPSQRGIYINNGKKVVIH